MVLRLVLGVRASTCLPLGVVFVGVGVVFVGVGVLAADVPRGEPETFVYLGVPVAGLGESGLGSVADVAAALRIR